MSNMNGWPGFELTSDLIDKVCTQLGELEGRERGIVALFLQKELEASKGNWEHRPGTPTAQRCWQALLFVCGVTPRLGGQVKNEYKSR